MQDAYSYLMDCWEPGDQVMVFGFSRGSAGYFLVYFSIISFIICSGVFFALIIS